MLEQIKGFKPEDDLIEKYEVEDKEDPRVAKFTVIDPIEVGGAVRYTITGADEEGEFKT